MTDANKTKAQLIAELQEARRRVAELERAEIHPDSTREREFKPTEPFLQIQRDLGLALSAAASLAETYKICVNTAIQASGMDCGGIYLVEKTGELNLAYHQGMSTEFIQQVAHYEADAPHVKMVLAGQPIYMNYPEFTGRLGLNRIEHLKVLAVIPISFKHQIIAVFNIASHTRTEIPDSSRVILEAIASQIGEAILRAQKERELELSQKQLRAMFDAVEDFLFIIDATGHILDINPTVITRRADWPASFSHAPARATGTSHCVYS
jgi:PAS domain-containing protein